MPKIDDNTRCNFFNQECLWPIPIEDLEEALEIAEEGETIRAVPFEDSSMCTNCLLHQLIILIEE